jgi:hypothetical protein
MNYERVYKNLVLRAKLRAKAKDEYYEKHHVIPRCMGGSDAKDNIVLLTPEEHFVAHQLLMKIYPNHSALIYAALMMTVSSCTVKRTNKAYGWIKRKYHNECKKRLGQNNPSYGTAWYHNPTTGAVKKIKKLEEIPFGWEKGRVRLNKTISCNKCGIVFNAARKETKKLCSQCRKASNIKNSLKSQFAPKLDDVEHVKLIVSHSKTWKECLRKLNYKSAGNSLLRIQKIATDYNVVLGSLVN